MSTSARVLRPLEQTQRSFQPCCSQSPVYRPMPAPCTECVVECTEPDCAEAEDVDMTPDCTPDCVVVACNDQVHAEGPPREVACDKPDCAVEYEEILQCCTDYHSYFAEPRVHAPDCMWTAAHDAMFRGPSAPPEPGPSMPQPAPVQTPLPSDMPMACMWDKCDSSFVSLTDLVAHVNSHHLRIPPAAPIAPLKSPTSAARSQFIPEGAPWPPFNGQQANLELAAVNDFAMRSPGGDDMLNALACHWGDCDVFPSPNSIPGSSSANDLDAARDILANHLLQDHLGLAYANELASSSSFRGSSFPDGQYPYEPSSFIPSPASYGSSYYTPSTPREMSAFIDRGYPGTNYAPGQSRGDYRPRYPSRNDRYAPRTSELVSHRHEPYSVPLSSRHHQPYTVGPLADHSVSRSQRGSESGSSVGRSPQLLHSTSFPDYEDQRGPPSSAAFQLPLAHQERPRAQGSVSPVLGTGILPISRSSSSQSGKSRAHSSNVLPALLEDEAQSSIAPKVTTSAEDTHECSTTAHVCHWKECTETFATCEALTTHLAAAHVGVGKAHYDCYWGTCARNGDTGFTSKQKILRHLQSHTGHRPFQCTTCKQNFSEAATLQQHMRRHTQEKPYVCDFPGCGKAFAITGALTIHKRTHNGHKPFKCMHCDRAFAESSNLSKHLRTHTGARPYTCTEPACGKSFARPDQLTRHMGIHLKKAAKFSTAPTPAPRAADLESSGSASSSSAVSTPEQQFVEDPQVRRSNVGFLEAMMDGEGVKDTRSDLFVF